MLFLMGNVLEDIRFEIINTLREGALAFTLQGFESHVYVLEASSKINILHYREAFKMHKCVVNCS